jgi:hypothetical protein
MIEPIMEASPRLKARIAGVFYAITIATGIYGLIIARGTHSGHAANLAASATYLVVTLLLYDLLKPVSKNLSLLAAFFSIVAFTCFHLSCDADQKSLTPYMRITNG